MSIENIIYFSLGFFIASLLGLAIMSRVWKRAVRLTKKRLESDKPISSAEILANKDQLRADFALSTRRLEKNIENLRKKISEQLAQISAIRNENAILHTQQTKQNANLSELEQNNIYAKERIFNLEKQNTDLSQRLRMRERELNDVKVKLTLIAKNYSSKTQITDVNTAETRISNASKHLNSLAQKANKKTNESAALNQNSNIEQPPTQGLLAKDLEVKDDLTRLKNKISDLENIIITKDRYSSKKIMREQLQEIARISASIMGSTKAKTTKEKEIEISLFDKVQKFAGENLTNVASKVKN